jgi:hypothetical protein
MAKYQRVLIHIFLANVSTERHHPALSVQRAQQGTDQSPGLNRFVPRAAPGISKELDLFRTAVFALRLNATPPSRLDGLPADVDNLNGELHKSDAVLHVQRYRSEAGPKGTRRFSRRFGIAREWIFLSVLF